MIFALLPAGGMSKRMGQPKLLLPYRGRTILHATVAAFHAAGVARVLVMASAEVAGLPEAADHAGAEVEVLDHPTPDMRQTVQAGLDRINRIWRPIDADLWFLSPADHPNLEPTTIRHLLGIADSHVERSIFIPVHEGRRGHPTLIRWSETHAIRAFAPDLGLNAYFRSVPERVREVPVGMAEGFIDLDTPQDYQRLLKHGGNA